MAKNKKKSGNFIQKAVAKMKKKGTLGSYGHHSEKTMEADKKKGGKIAKKANFALNMRKIANKRKRSKSGK